MAAQTLNEVLSRTREFHDVLAAGLSDSAAQTDDRRAELLLDYLSDHERKLSAALQELQNSADKKQLDTWFYEFAQKHNVLRTDAQHKPFSEMSTEEIMAEVSNEHEQIIELYRYLYGRALTSSSHELLRELIDLEEHEAMKMVQQGERSDEM